MVCCEVPAAKRLPYFHVAFGATVGIVGDIRIGVRNSRFYLKEIRAAIVAIIGDA